MPTGTKVDEVYQALLKKGYSKAKAARIAQSQTGAALATGKPPKHPVKAANRPGGEYWARNLGETRDNLAKRQAVGDYSHLTQPKQYFTPPSLPPPSPPKAPVATANDPLEDLTTPSSTRVTPSPGNKVLKELREGKVTRQSGSQVDESSTAAGEGSHMVPAKQRHIDRLVRLGHTPEEAAAKAEKIFAGLKPEEIEERVKSNESMPDSYFAANAFGSGGSATAGFRRAMDARSANRGFRAEIVFKERSDGGSCFTSGDACPDTFQVGAAAKKRRPAARYAGYAWPAGPVNWRRQ